MNPIGAVIGRYFELRAGMARALHPRRLPMDAAARELHEQGVVILPGRIPVDVVEELNNINAPYFSRSAPEELIYSPDGKELLEFAGAKDTGRFYFLHIKNYQEKLDIYSQVVVHVHSTLVSYYGTKFFVRDLYCYRTQPIPRVSGSYQWHVDNYPAGSLKVMVYLTDVGDSGGPLAVARGSHVNFRAKLGSIGRRYEDDYVRARFPIIECFGKAGTVVIFNNNAIHRAVDPQRGTRDVVNFTVFPRVFGGRPSVRGLDLHAESSFLKKYTR